MRARSSHNQLSTDNLHLVFFISLVKTAFYIRFLDLHGHNQFSTDIFPTDLDLTKAGKSCVTAVIRRVHLTDGRKHTARNDSLIGHMAMGLILHQQKLAVGGVAKGVIVVFTVVP